MEEREQKRGGYLSLRVAWDIKAMEVFRHSWEESLVIPLTHKHVFVLSSVMGRGKKRYDLDGGREGEGRRDAFLRKRWRCGEDLDSVPWYDREELSSVYIKITYRNSVRKNKINKRSKSKEEMEQARRAYVSQKAWEQEGTVVVLWWIHHSHHHPRTRSSAAPPPLWVYALGSPPNTF